MISRRAFLAAGGIGLLAVHRPGTGQPAVSVRRVGWLSLGGRESVAHLYAAFTQGMRDLGWIDGRNIEYRFTYADGAVERLDALALELIAQRVDVIIVGNPQSTHVAQRSTKTIPIVMASVGDPVGNGFVASLARPGGNITGVTSQPEHVLGKAIAILHEIVPGARRIAVVLNERNPTHPLFWTAAHQACSALSVDALRIAANSSAELGVAVEQVRQERVQAVVFVPDPVYLGDRVKLQALMAPLRLPAAYGWREHVAAGGLLSYSADLAASFRYAATYVDRILRGAKPADLPVEQANKFELVINLRTASALGLSIPQSLLLRADEVIK